MTSDLATLDAALRAARALPNAEKLPALERLAGDLRRRCLAGEAAPEALGGRAQALLLSPRLFLARRDGAWRRWARAAARAAAPRLVVSLTSYGRRVATVARVVERMLAQTRPPDLVVLYLARAEFPDEAALPGSLRALLGERFQVRLVEDLKSHKKYFYAFQEFADAAIVTIDDDVLYPADLLARLWASYLRHPYAVTCARAHTICFGQDGAYAPYAAWLGAPKIYNRLSLCILFTSGAGTLYPPHAYLATRPSLTGRRSKAPAQRRTTCGCPGVSWREGFPSSSFRGSGGMPISRGRRRRRSATRIGRRPMAPRGESRATMRNGRPSSRRAARKAN